MQLRMYFGLAPFYLSKELYLEVFRLMNIWEIVRFILTTLLILTDSSTSWPVGQVRYVEIILFNVCLRMYLWKCYSMTVTS